jgi:hypothetical protein
MFRICSCVTDGRISGSSRANEDVDVGFAVSRRGHFIFQVCSSLIEMFCICSCVTDGRISGSSRGNEDVDVGFAILFQGHFIDMGRSFRFARV